MLKHLQRLLLWQTSKMLRLNVILVFFCLGAKIRHLNAKTLTDQETIPMNASDVRYSDFKSFLPVGDKAVKISTQNIPDPSSSGGSVQPPCVLSRPSGICLGLSVESVDDMYLGCNDKMLIKVKQQYLPMSTTDGLNSTITKHCALKAMQSKDSDDKLSFDHFRAVCAYIGGSQNDLNQAVSKGRAYYNTTFKFHALHFLLSDAIRLLKVNQRKCQTTFRRSTLLFMGKPGQTVRFGSFASSSFDKMQLRLGRRTCFKIRTCFGAYLKFYTDFYSDDDEILIPPFEMFKIVSVDTTGKNEMNCDVFYQLEPAGVYSNLNCQLFNA